MNADAVRGMQPKVTIWNTGANNDANNDGMKPIVKMVQSMAPLLSGLQEQGGLGDALGSLRDGLLGNRTAPSAAANCASKAFPVGSAPMLQKKHSAVGRDESGKPE